MKSALSFLLLGPVLSFGQTSPGSTASKTSASAPKTCVVLQRMGLGSEVTSRLHSLGMRTKEFRFVEGETPPGIKFRGRLTDHDVSRIQDHEGRVVILAQKYTDEDLQSARQDCYNLLTGEPPPRQMSSTGGYGPDVVVDVKASPTLPQKDSAASAPPMATLDVTSQPAGADIVIDGTFVGNAPFKVGLTPGNHTIKISKKGFRDWQRKIKATSGSLNVAAELESEP